MTEELVLGVGAVSERDRANGESDATGAEPDETGEVEPVELLVGLAEEGEIDPWDIDIVEVTDAFLSRLEAADLRTTGRALFYASVLLRMKSDELLAPDEPDEDEIWNAPWDDPWGDPVEGGPDPIDGLEREMERRLERKRARGKPRTLDELVRELRDAERDSWWKSSREYDTSGSPTGFLRGTQTLDYRDGDGFRLDDEPTEDEVTGTAHAEDVDEIIEAVRTALAEHYDAGRVEVLFEEIADVTGSRVETYLGLLFLAHRGEIELQQDELFGDLWVRNPTATTAPEPLVGRS